MSLPPDLHATLVPGDPPRTARLAFWPLAPDDPRAEEIELVLPVSGGVRRRKVGALVLPVRSVLDDLVQVRPDAAMTRSVRAWAQVARVALELVAKGRLRPSVSPAGFDAWTVGPLSERDRQVRAALGSWLPPEAHCLPIEGGAASEIRSPVVAVSDLYQAVADLMPRTAAAGAVSGQWAWSGDAPQDASRLRPHVAPADDTERTIVGLRLELPTSEDQPFRVTLQVRSALEPTRVADAEDLWAGRAPGFHADAEAALLLALRRAARLWAPLGELLDQPEPTELELADEDAMDLLDGLGELLAAAGVELLVPTAVTRTLRAVAHVEAPPGARDGPVRFDLDSVCQLTWRATLDGEPVGDDELEALAASHRPLVKLRDEWVVVDRKLLAKLRQRGQISGADALTAALGGTATIDDEQVEVAVAPPIAAMADDLRNASRPAEVPEPAGLTATLRPYQRRGVGWMAAMADLGFGGVLADDMGLGKTVQLISLHLHRIERGSGGRPTLVVAPASVVANWHHELTRFAPSIGVHRYHGVGRSLAGVGPDDVVLTTYGIARRDHAVLAEQPWGLLVADEAQQIKNPASSTAKALRGIPAQARLALTGTPVENRLTELWALLDWTTPGLLGPVERFRRNVAIPIERDRDEEARGRFGAVIAPFLLRRRKDDPLVAPDLPPKTETVHPVVLTEEQAGLYRAVVDEVMSSIATSDGMKRRGLVLKLLTSLKQICNHPAHYLSSPGPLAGRSGKLDAFDDLITAIADAGDSTLVFTQYVEMGQLLLQRLSELDLPAEMLHGSLSLARRAEMVERFQRGEFPVFVVSLRAGGTGLNLTRATHVVHFDRWWNPAVEAQASDRAWRIGQDRPVQVHQLISEGTLEERIAQVLADKRELAEAVVGSGESWIGELSDSELIELVQLGAG